MIFCSKIIYLVGPTSRSVNQNTGDKTWAFKFPYNKEGVVEVKVAYVCTFKAKDAKYDMKKRGGDSIVLSVRHNSLLAMLTMNRITDICCSLPEPIIMLTPLCGAIFSKLDISKMQEVMRMKISDLVKILNTSCQSGGHYLADSDLSVAAVASIVATNNLAIKGKNDERAQIITKTIKQYLNVHKSYNENTFMVIAEYATGGISSNLEPNKLIKLYKDVKEGKSIGMGALGALNASRRTAMKANKDDILRKGKRDDDSDDDDDYRGGQASGGLGSERWWSTSMVT